ncbi:MAG: family hydrolase [Sphingomonas bacterium]|nr:family hydrolase [Sphingomonas bacterium]
MSEAERIDAVLFDVDGTLIDSNDLHAAAWAQAFRDFGFTIPVAMVRGQIGKGGDNLVPALLPELSEARSKELRTYRSDLFKRDYIDRITVFPGVCELFTRIRADDRAIVLATSASGDELDFYLDLLGCRELLSGTTSADDVAHSKPDPDIFTAAARTAGVAPAQAIVIGDTPYDAVAAAKAGVRAIGFRSGGFDEEALREAGVIALFDGPADLLARYDRSPLA